MYYWFTYVNSPGILIELRNAKESLSKYEKRTSSLVVQNDSQASRIQELEELLEKQSELMTLSGQADMIAKIASLSCEMSALRSDWLLGGMDFGDRRSEEERGYNLRQVSGNTKQPVYDDSIEKSFLERKIEGKLLLIYICNFHVLSH